MSEKLLEIKDLHVMYKTDSDDVFALNGINLSLNKGDTLGLVGETGAGKTTIALSIMRLLPDRVGFITGGEILFDGKDLLKATEHDMQAIRGNDISMIFADPMSSLNPTHTVGAQIGEVLELHHPEYTKAQVQEKVEEMLEMVGIPRDRKDEYPHQFSGGMKQRIVIAMALACNPRLLLADEPTTALDVTIQAQVLKMMDELQQKLDTAMLLITHDLGVVAQVCNSVAIIYAGEIIEIGTVEDIYEGAEHHPYTVGLFGSIPDLTTKTRRLTPIDGLMPDLTELPKGCRFADRCPKCMDICHEQAPGIWSNGTHQIRCHLYAKEGQTQ
jgi:peptide/nickel transport system ATP-binding protein